MQCRGCPVAIFLGAGSLKISKQGKEKMIKSKKRKRRKKSKNILEKITKLNEENSEHYRKTEKVKKKSTYQPLTVLSYLEKAWIAWPCQNELQKEYCVKIKVIALD